MTPDFRWIEAVYGRPKSGPEGYNTHIAVPPSAEKTLKRMAAELVGTERLVALYIPEGTDDQYQPGPKRGRIVGAVQLLPMPLDKTVHSYVHKDWDGTPRWPIGWPARLVYAPPIEQCPTLREHVESLFPDSQFRSYVKRLQQGPFELEPKMRERLNRDFARFQPVDAKDDNGGASVSSP